MKIIDINGQQRECLNVSLDEKWPGYFRVDFESKRRIGFKHSEWYLTADFLKNNPSLINLAKKAPKLPKEDLGVVSKATINSLTDKTKNWRENIFAGYPVWISRGKGESQTRTVLSNTNHRLTINKPWEIIPDKTSQYVISRNVNDPQILGNVLPEAQQIKPKQKKKKQ